MLPRPVQLMGFAIRALACKSFGVTLGVRPTHSMTRQRPVAGWRQLRIVPGRSRPAPTRDDVVWRRGYQGRSRLVQEPPATISYGAALPGDLFLLRRGRISSSWLASP